MQVAIAVVVAIALAAVGFLGGRGGREQLDASAERYEQTYGRVLNAPVTGPRSWVLAGGPERQGFVAGFQWGQRGDIPVAGDWTGGGVDLPGLYRPATGEWFLRLDRFNNDEILGFAYGGGASYSPVVGDWDGDGKDTIGLFEAASGTWLLRNSNRGGDPDVSRKLGQRGDVGVAGDWDGDGSDDIAVWRPSRATFFLEDRSVTYGLPTDLPVAGDWTASGKDTVGVFRPSEGRFYFLRSLTGSGPGNFAQFGLGGPTDTPIIGRWDPRPTGKRAGDQFGVTRLTGSG